MSFTKNTIKAFRNKYIFSLVAFVLFMLFIDHNDLFVQCERKSDLKKLLATKEFYNQRIEETRKELSDLQNNSAALEKYAREHFLLKRDNEDIFIIDNSTKEESSKK